MTTTLSEVAKLVKDQVSFEDNITQVLNVVMPNLYDMGYWKDLTFEESLTAQYGQNHVALPHYAESVIAGMINGFPIATKAQWADYKIKGMVAAGPPALFGLVDDGLHASMATVPSTGDDFVFTVIPATHEELLPDEGEILLDYVNGDGDMKRLTLSLDGTASMTSAEVVTAISRIQFRDVPDYVTLAVTDGADISVEMATNRGNVVSRYRWFRFNRDYYDSDPSVVLWMKRAFEPFLRTDDIVWLSDVNAVRNGLLGYYYETQGDLERSTSYQALAERSLTKQVESYRAAALPDVDFKPAGQFVNPVQNSY